jgi:hypothetical protein
MSFKPLQLYNGFLFLLLVVVNGYIYVHRDDGFAYTSYLNKKQLYSNSENTHIENFILRGLDSLEVIIAPSPYHWLVKGSSQKELLNDKNPIIKLQEGKHSYVLYNKTDSIIVGFDVVDSKTYQKSGRTRASVVELCYTSVPLNNYNYLSISEWQQASLYTTEQEIEDAKLLLKDSLHILPNDSSIQIIQKISRYILKYTGTNKGIPSNAMDSLSPTKQFEFAKNKQSAVWCGNFTDMFSFYASCAGITTRLVCLEGKIGDVSKAGHSFNEAYIKELKQWVFVDLTSNSVFAQSPSKQYLNSIDFYNLYKLAPKDIIITRVINDSIKQENFNSVKDFYDDYFQANDQFVFYNHKQFENNTYSFLSKIKRYTSKNPTFSIYTEAVENDNDKFWIKQTALYALLCFSLYWIMSTVILKRKR